MCLGRERRILYARNVIVLRLLRPEDRGGAAEDERRKNIRRIDAAQRGMFQVDGGVVPLVDPECGGALVGSEAEERVGRDDVAAASVPSRDALELAPLLERVDPDVRVGADAEADTAFAEPLDRREAVSEVRLRRGAEADPGARIRDQVELGPVGVSGVDDGRVGAKAPTLCE